MRKHHTIREYDAEPRHRDAPSGSPGERGGFRIGELGPASFRQAAKISALAFMDDPLYIAAAPDPARRADAARAVAGLYLRYGALYGSLAGAFGLGGDSAADPGRLLGFSVWLPPSVPDLTPLRMLRTGALRMLFEAGLAELGRLWRVDPPAAAARAGDTPGPVEYLLLLAVDPEAQGRGVGGALLARGLALADAQACPAYLETQNPANAEYYRRYGFRIASRRPVPGLPGVEHYSMTRAGTQAGNASDSRAAGREDAPEPR
jgi:ribosomal protein S18 acetylase RimI-like enzyme